MKIRELCNYLDPCSDAELYSFVMDGDCYLVYEINHIERGVIPLGKSEFPPSMLEPEIEE